MSKELNKAPVEHAGGDERDLQGAQGERDGWGPLPIVQVPWNVFDRAVMWVEDRRRYGDDGTIVDDWKALKTIQRAALAQPSPAQAEKAEVEWPEVVGQLVTWPTGQRYVGRVRERKGCKTEDVMTVSQHDRIVGELRAEIAMLRSYEAEWELLLNEHEQQRDAALARVAELEACGAPALLAAADYFAERAKGPSPGWVTLSAVAKELRVRADKAPVAKAQHSVPEGWMLVECGIWTQEQVDEMQKTVARFRNSEFVDDRALAMAVADAGQCKAPEISLAELLAAAPGKEVGHE